MPDADARTSRRRTLAAIVCVALAIAFSLHAWLATRAKSPTFDEPVHAFSAWLIVNRGDFRVNPEHPALWKYLAGLPLVGFPLRVELDGNAAREMLSVLEQQWPFTVDTLFRTPGNDGVALVGRARMAMAVVPCLLALVVARWAWRLKGPTAAIVATLLLTLDPNLLAHGALVTNDVAATLIFATAGYLTWSLGERFTWRRAAALAGVCAVGIGVKASCVLLVMTVGLPLYAWAYPPTGRFAAGGSRRGRCARAAAIAVAGVALAYALLWPAYQFRAAPTPAGDRFDAGYAAKLYAYNRILDRARRDGQPIDDAEIKRRVPTFEPDNSTRRLAALGERGLVPQAFAVGYTYARARAVLRPTYLLGEQRVDGSFAYFPLALLFKTPTATIALALAAAVAGAAIARHALPASRAARWAAAALILPAFAFFGTAVAANLNIGVRHVLPALPFVYVGVGVVAAGAIERWRAALPIVAGAILATGVEVFAATPNYLAFFNAPSGGARGGLSKLGDSNLDWGQDLPALADWYALWRRANPTTPFYLSYFGSADPRVYGIDYVNATPGYPFDPRPATDAYARDGGILAISATALQGLVDEPSRPLMAALRNAEPLDVLNGSIYIYRLSASPTGTESPR